MNISRRTFLHLTSGTALALSLRSLSAQPKALIKKTIPATGEAIPAIGLGTNRYAVGSDQENALLRDALEVFHRLGGRVIDTAPMYRSSESILGQLVAELDHGDEVFLATKADRAVDKGGIERLEESFKKLRTDTLDLVQSHNLIGAESMLPVLREYKQEGRIRYVGITTSRNAQFAEFLEWMERGSLDFIQVNYSLADRAAADRILPLAREKGMAVLVNLPLGRGRLFKAVDGKPLPDWVAEFQCESWAQFFLKYVISHPAVTCAIPGMTKAPHVMDNLGALTGRLPDAAERMKMEALFDGL